MRENGFAFSERPEYRPIEESALKRKGDSSLDSKKAAACTHAPTYRRCEPRISRLAQVLIALGVILVTIAVVLSGALLLQRRAATQPPANLSVSDTPAESSASSELPAVDWEYWTNTNPDIVAWIVIPGSSISQPIAYAPQKEEGYYLTHDAQGMPNIYGCPYITNRCEGGIESQNVLILGHNMSDGTMFAELLSYQDADFLAAHRSIYILTPNGTQEYAVSKVYISDSPLSIEQTSCKSITLVTCADNDDSPRRLLVAAQSA